MKFKSGDIVIYAKISNDRKNNMLTLFDSYVVTDVLYHKIDDIELFNKQKFLLSLKDKYGVISYWYNSVDFLTKNEYRKIKLNKIKNGIL